MKEGEADKVQWVIQCTTRVERAELIIIEFKSYFKVQPLKVSSHLCIGLLIASSCSPGLLALDYPLQGTEASITWLLLVFCTGLPIAKARP